MLVTILTGIAVGSMLGDNYRIRSVYGSEHAPNLSITPSRIGGKQNPGSSLAPSRVCGAMAGHDKRQHARRTVLLECYVEGASGLAPTRISDLCVSGCYVDSRLPVTVGSFATIRLSLAGTPLALTGRVIHGQQGIGFGLQFDALPAVTRDLIARFLESSQEER